MKDDDYRSSAFEAKNRVQPPQRKSWLRLWLTVELYKIILHNNIF